MLANTSEGLDQCVSFLCQADIYVDEEVKEIVNKLLSQGKKKHLLETASFFGSKNVLDYLLNQTSQRWDELMISKALKNVILSDKVKACEIVFEHYEKLHLMITEDMSSLVIARGKTDIVKLFGLQVITMKNEKILENIPRTQEYPYYDLMAKHILPLVENACNSSGGLLKYDELIKNLHVKDIHYKVMCPHSCSQPQTCERIRDVDKLLKDILKKMGEEYPIFKNVETIVVGSLKENTKVSHPNKNC